MKVSPLSETLNRAVTFKTQRFAKVFVWTLAASCANNTAELGIIWKEPSQPLLFTSPNKDKLMTNKE